MNKSLLLLTILASLLVFLNVQVRPVNAAIGNAKSQQDQQFSDDEFSEFDSMDDDGRVKKEQVAKKQAQKPKNTASDDFSSFDGDATVSNEDEEIKEPITNDKQQKVN